MASELALDASGSASLEEALSGSLGWLAVREIATNPMRHGVGPLLDMDGAGSSPDLALTRTKYKPGRKLTASYQLRSARGGPERTVAVRWHAAPLAGDIASGPYQATSDDGRVSLLVSPADPSMPQLERLHRPDHLMAVLSDLDRNGRPDSARPTVETIRYRPGERHVLRVSTARPWADVFVKTDKHDSGRRAVPAATAVAASLARSCPDVGIAEPVGYASSDAAAVWRRADGAPLSQVVRDDVREAGHVLGLLGRAARVIHDDGLGQVDALTVDLLGDELSADREVTATLRASEHITALLPASGRTFAALVADIARELEGRSIEAPTLIHGDLKCDNVMVTGRRIRLLDFDRTGLGDPALDLGRLMADLRWSLMGDGRTSDELVEAFRSGYGPCDDGRWERARPLSVLFQLKFAARRCQVHDEGWAERVHARILDAATNLERERALG
jgi:aminoglycoside phosphotransferase (APT) family kinase protein